MQNHIPETFPHCVNALNEPRWPHLNLFTTYIPLKISIKHCKFIIHHQRGARFERRCDARLHLGPLMPLHIGWYSVPSLQCPHKNRSKFPQALQLVCECSALRVSVVTLSATLHSIHFQRNSITGN